MGAVVVGRRPQLPQAFGEGAIIGPAQDFRQPGQLELEPVEGTQDVFWRFPDRAPHFDGMRHSQDHCAPDRFRTSGQHRMADCRAPVLSHQMAGDWPSFNPSIRHLMSVARVAGSKYPAPGISVGGYPRRKGATTRWPAAASAGICRSQVCAFMQQQDRWPLACFQIGEAQSARGVISPLSRGRLLHGAGCGLTKSSGPRTTSRHPGKSPTWANACAHPHR